MLTKATDLTGAYKNNYKTIFKYYIGIFKDRSMEILTEILTLLKKSTYIFKKSQNLSGAIQISLEKLLNNLLNDYVADQIEKSWKKSCFLNGEPGYDKCVANVVKKKLGTLNSHLVRMIFNQAIDLVNQQGI